MALMAGTNLCGGGADRGKNVNQVHFSTIPTGHPNRYCTTCPRFELPGPLPEE